MKLTPSRFGDLARRIMFVALASETTSNPLFEMAGPPHGPHGTLEKSVQRVGQFLRLVVGKTQGGIRSRGRGWLWIWHERLCGYPPRLSKAWHSQLRANFRGRESNPNGPKNHQFFKRKKKPCNLSKLDYFSSTQLVVAGLVCGWK